MCDKWIAFSLTKQSPKIMVSDAGWFRYISAISYLVLRFLIRYYPIISAMIWGLILLIFTVSILKLISDTDTNIDTEILNHA